MPAARFTAAGPSAAGAGGGRPTARQPAGRRIRQEQPAGGCHGAPAAAAADAAAADADAAADAATAAAADAHAAADGRTAWPHAAAGHERLGQQVWSLIVITRRTFTFRR